MKVAARRSPPFAVLFLLFLVLLASVLLLVFGFRAYAAEEAEARDLTREALDGALREMAEHAARILRDAEHAADLQDPREPPASDLLGAVFLVDPAGTILYPRLRSYPRADPPPEKEAEAVRSFVAEARKVARARDDPLEGVPFVEEAIGFYLHPDLAGVLVRETARLYAEGGKTGRARELLSDLFARLYVARDLEGRPLAPYAAEELCRILAAEGENERLAETAVELGECLADHAWNLSPLERGRLLSGVEISLDPVGLPRHVRERASFVSALRSRLIPESTALLPGRPADSWGYVVATAGSGRTEILGWRVFDPEGDPQVYGYLLSGGAFRRRIMEAATEVAKRRRVGIRIGANLSVAGPEPAGEDGLFRRSSLCPELTPVPIEVSAPRPRGPLLLRILPIGTALVLGVALLTGVFLSWRALRREWATARLRQDFIDNVSHELRTPLTSIRMYAEMLSEEEGITEEKREQYLSWILRESERLSRLVDDVLDFSRLSRGEPVFRPEATDPADLARETAELLAPLAGEHGVEIRLDLPDALPRVRTDRDATGRALANLLANAVRYSGEGKEVGIEVREEDARVLLAVWDRGPGIPEDAREHLFERFYRAPRDMSATKGAGLGLVLAREIARAQGGDVFLEETSGAGSRFALALPVWKEEA